ncbi:MAG TPA: KTSC domain-containing protein [Blastocatellia bacterium]
MKIFLARQLFNFRLPLEPTGGKFITSGQEGSPGPLTTETRTNQAWIMVINRLQVTSSSIRSVGYDPVGQILEIEFGGGTVYQYSGVPAWVVKEFLEAESLGRYLNETIKKANYPFARVA